jgi:hypothetical protein
LAEQAETMVAYVRMLFVITSRQTRDLASYRSSNTHMELLRRIAFVAITPISLGAQVIDLTVNDIGLAIGDKPRVTGIRLNFRDRNLVEVNGINVTMWTPYETPAGSFGGRVNGLALGLPATGAGEVRGAMIGVFGGGVARSLRGIGIGGIGIGAGGEVRGIMIGGIGVGAGTGGITGLTIGGVGAGSAGPLRGIQVGGIGVGGGGDVTGISIGGIGVGGAGNVVGLAIGGIGVGGGGTFNGIGIGGIGVGTAKDATGLLIGGIGVGSGGTVKGLSIGGVGVGAPAIKGVAIGGAGVGGVDIHAIVLTAGYFKIENDGRFDGAAIAAVSNIKGAQHGLTIGLFNYARELHGAQIGLINISDNGGARRVFPVLSVR